MSRSGMHIECVGRIAEVAAGDWNSLEGTSHPFLRHEFLAALESHGCVGEATGWRPCHALARDPGGRLVGAVPLYLKDHSWGEFVFDWSWAHAAQQAGLAYYPKLLAAIPFTPVTGPRLLTAPGAAAADVRRGLAEALRELAIALGVSGAHVNFTLESDQDALESAGFLRRHDCRFLWHNAGYSGFDGFLQRLRSEKRKKIRRERRKVADSGIRFETWPGESLDAAGWQVVFAFSEQTFQRHGNAHYLSAGVLAEISRRLPGTVVVKLALRGPSPVAAAVFFVGGGCLYGRYWGSAGHEDSLHFETCYYQGIDYCIEHGLAAFDPGTQGEHKLLRGFEPSVTRSAHWLADARLRGAIGRHLERERSAVSRYMAAAREHLPFHRDEGPVTAAAEDGQP